jgi:deoxycytidine triphosphate deaminase
MYLTDAKIRSRLGDLAIQTDNEELPFDPEAQIQPCSIDLRLSPVYWKLLRGRRRTIDLTRTKLMEMNPKRSWEKRTLAGKDVLILKPGEMVLARVYEQLSIPEDCAGALEGRSSFARMGLSIHATGGFINPGWRGHMPLTLVNNSTATLRIPAYLPICQLMLVPLGESPDRVYGDDSLTSKYVDDDGGPSYWWRDKMFRKLQEAAWEADLSDDILDRLVDRMGPPDDLVLERLERFVDSLPHGELSSADEVLELFTRREDRIRMRDRLLTKGVPALTGILVASSIGVLFVTPITLAHWILWAITVLSLPLGAAGVLAGPRTYFGKREQRDLAEMRANGIGPSPVTTAS